MKCETTCCLNHVIEAKPDLARYLRMNLMRLKQLDDRVHKLCPKLEMPHETLVLRFEFAATTKKRGGQ